MIINSNIFNKLNIFPHKTFSFQKADLRPKGDWQSTLLLVHLSLLLAFGIVRI